MSLPEVLLWRELRGQVEVKFRRQHPIGPYCLDFYCAEAKVCIEVDGAAHDLAGQAANDAQRTLWLEQQGIEVVRVPARDVLSSPAVAAEALVRYCRR